MRDKIRGDVGDYNQSTVSFLLGPFLKDAKIIHFEMSYGFKPYVVGERTIQGMGSKSGAYGYCVCDSTPRLFFMDSNDSLEVYFENNELSGLFPSPNGLIGAKEFHSVHLSGWSLLYLDTQLRMLSPYSVDRLLYGWMLCRLYHPAK